MKDNLLKEQLAESGLEMQIGAIFAGIGAITGIFGAASGASQAAEQNRKAEERYQEQKKLAKEAADKTNEYNAKKFEVDKENYYKQAQYNFDTAVESWQYQTTVRALGEKVDAEKYLMNVQNSQRQLTFNDVAAQQASSREQLAFNDAMSEYRFQAQDQLVAQLQAQGQSRLGQAGRSLNKRDQGVRAQIGKDLAVISASLSGEIAASNLRMFDINLGKYSADAAVEASRMLRPERLPDIPAPTRSPEPVWLEPMKILPQMPAAPQTQSVFAPLISGIGSAVSNLGRIDWNSGATQQNAAFKAVNANLAANPFG
jgi:hypothetical protein